MTLNVQQCRELFQAVEKSGLNPRNCELCNPINDKWTRIIHVQTGNNICIRRYFTLDSRYYISYNRPAHFLPWSGTEHGFLWPAVLERVEEWASQIAAAGDIWRSFIIDRRTSADPRYNVDNTPFDASEREDIGKRLRQIPAQVRERFDLSAEQESNIKQKLDDLIAASERVGKKDFLVMVYGTAFGLIVNDEIPAHAVQAIITMIVTGIGYFFGIGSPPPFIPPHA